MGDSLSGSSRYLVVFLNSFPIPLIVSLFILPYPESIPSAEYHWHIEPDCESDYERGLNGELVLCQSHAPEDAANF